MWSTLQAADGTPTLRLETGARSGRRAPFYEQARSPATATRQFCVAASAGQAKSVSRAVDRAIPGEARILESGGWNQGR